MADACVGSGVSVWAADLDSVHYPLSDLGHNTFLCFGITLAFDLGLGVKQEDAHVALSRLLCR